MTKHKPIMVAVTVLFSGIAMAQKVDPFDAHCADILMLQGKDVQAEMGISKAQRDRMNVYADAHRKKLADLRKEAEEKHTDVRERLVQYYGELKEKVLAELTTGQVRRLRELTLQRLGLAALRDTVVQNKLTMTKAQGDLFEKLFKEGATKFQEAEQKAAEPILKPYVGKTAKTKEEAAKWEADIRAKMDVVKKRIQPQLHQIQDSYDARLRAVLTSEQSKAYKALLGAPFHPSQKK